MQRPAPRLIPSFAHVLLGLMTMMAAVLLVTARAAAATPGDEEIVRELLVDGVYVEPGSGVAEASVTRAVGELASEDVTVYFVALGQEPPAPAGSRGVAASVGEQLGRGTLIVRSPADFGYYSFDYDERRLARADEASFDLFRAGEDAAGIRTFADTMQRSGGLGVSPGTVVVLGILLIGGVALFRGSRSTRRVAAQRVAEARTEVRHQIDFLSEKILAISDRVTIGPPQAQEAYAVATTAFRQASEGFAAATGEAELTQLNDSLDRARWQLEVAAALLDGNEPPAEPDDAPACFFDPDHGAGVQQATLQTAAGDRQVGVCDYCATKLDRGEAPEPRRIPVGGDAVPVSMAPREYGGRGMHDLDAFSILFGRGGPVPYRWGGGHARRSRRSHSGWGGGWGGGGGFGGGFGGGIGGGSGRARGAGGGRRFIGGGGRGAGGGRSFGGGGRGGGGRGAGGGRRF